MGEGPPSFTLRFERALRLAASGHRDQVRKGSGVPYVEHPMGVALILDRAGFEEDVVIAGLLHDLVEDTEITLEQVREGFGDPVAGIDRKRGHLEEIPHATDAVRAVVLADKLHNLISIQVDLLDGVEVWEKFNAGKDQVLWYYRSMINACRSDDPRLFELARQCSALLDEVASL